MIWFIAYFSLLNSILPLHAKTSDRICRDLYSATCSPGENQDPTGKARPRGFPLFERQAVERATSVEVGKLVKTTLAKSSSQNFYEVALEAYGLDGLPDCRDQNSPACKDRVAKAIEDQLYHEVYYSELDSPSKVLEMKDLASTAFLSEHPVMAKMRTSLKDVISQQLDKQDVANKVEKEIFPKLKEIFVEWLRENLPESEVRSNLIFKIKHIEFNGFDCSPDGQNLSVDLLPNANYHNIGNRINYCSGSLLFTDSVFSIVSTLAHEMGHAIDPCNIQYYIERRKFSYEGKTQEEKEQEYPFAGLISCLRGQDSVGAQFYKASPPSKLNPQTSQGQSDSPSSSVGSQQEAEFNFCDEYQEGVCVSSDQIGESVSDWFAAEILPRYMDKYYSGFKEDQFRNGYINVFRQFCSPSRFKNQNEGFDVHPELERRVNAILLTNPRVQKHLGCSSEGLKAKYCGLSHDRDSSISDSEVKDSGSFDSPNSGSGKGVK